MSEVSQCLSRGARAPLNNRFMSVETATYIDDLDATLPAATDGLSEADNHIRLLKGDDQSNFPEHRWPGHGDRHSAKRNRDACWRHHHLVRCG